MPVITLPDGSQRSFDGPVSVAEIAAAIGPGLSRAAVAGKVDGQLVDTDRQIAADAAVAIVTDKDAEGLEVIRHSTAHLMAQAVKSLFPEAQVTIGPVIEDGFYYDFAFERPFTPEDLERIEARMQELAKADLQVSRQVMKRAEAVKFFRDQGENYKAEIIEGIPDGEEIGLYAQGEWTDLCRGPHVPSTGKLKAFKLTRVAGAYWRGDSSNEMLQRIYGTAWPDKKSLKDYLHRLEEAEKRDHRRFGKVMDLFHFQEEAPGMVFWHDRGWRLYRTIKNYIKFREHMFTVGDEDQRVYAIKPMNCPGHVQIYNRALHSYRDLPLRMAEFGSCHRNEASGTLHGLMRVRAFVQDDAHIFCADDQIQSEVAAFMDLAFSVYEDFGFTDVATKLSTRPEQRVGADELWDKAEVALQNALNERGLDWQLQPGDGAFYGPKIDFDFRDSLGRVWQLGTVQLDFSMPERLGATYVAKDGSRQTPVMLHRAILGSFERFIGILLEHHAGDLPVWLAPVQAVVLNITDRQADYARQVLDSLQDRGFRVEADLRNEKIGYKIREHTLQRVPYLLVVGDREIAANAVAVRTRSGEDLGSMPLERLAKGLQTELASHGRTVMEG
jgi:threonyl-tRNA synthetase